MRTLDELIEQEHIVFVCLRHNLELEFGERTCPYCQETNGGAGHRANRPVPKRPGGDEFALAVQRGIDAVLYPRGESTRSYMQRTSLVDYNNCRAAGRF